jgi:hypothetical protein
MTSHSDIFTPLAEAWSQIQRRRQDTELLQAIEDSLSGDIPPHFRHKSPILYLCRYIATPNFETLRFIELGKPLGAPLVISEDSKGTFFSNNSLKRALGKMSVVKGITRHYDEITENFTVVNFAEAEGMSFGAIRTKGNNALIDLHHELFSLVYPTGITIVDESEWIDRHHRENLVEHYKHLLTLLIAHGIMLESYPAEESRLINEVVIPAFEYVTKEFGHRPLLCELISSELEPTRDWNAYPSVLYRRLKDEFKRNDNI